jgi:putative sterol carrier protein
MSEEKKKIADDVMKHMEKVLNENKDLNEGWGKSDQVIFTDIETGYWIKFAMDGSVEKMVKKPASEIKLEDAEATVSCTVDVIKDVMDGKTNAMEAMGEGKFKIDGPLAALMKLGPAIM